MDSYFKFQISEFNFIKCILNVIVRHVFTQFPYILGYIDKTKVLFDNPIQRLNLMDSNLNIFKPFDNQKIEHLNKLSGTEFPRQNLFPKLSNKLFTYH